MAVAKVMCEWMLALYGSNVLLYLRSTGNDVSTAVFVLEAMQWYGIISKGSNVVVRVVLVAYGSVPALGLQHG